MKKLENLLKWTGNNIDNQENEMECQTTEQKVTLNDGCHGEN